MTRPRLLDLFCGAGGAGVGYQRAGFDVVGVDIEPHPDTPYPVIVADAADIIADKAFMDGFDAVHASPPCPRYSTITANPERHPDLVPWVRAALTMWGRPYVIENVPGAPLRSPTILCGSSFGLGVRRHRLFETSFTIWSPPACMHASQGTPVGVYGDHPDSREFLRPNGTRRGAKARSVDEGRAAMGIDWMDWHDLTDAIPPAYTEYIGAQLIDHLTGAAA